MRDVEEGGEGVGGGVRGEGMLGAVGMEDSENLERSEGVRRGGGAGV
jgi:hypothetical protein